VLLIRPTVFITLLLCADPDYDFTKQLTDVDCYEKETAILECEVNYEEAPTHWIRDDIVSPGFLLRYILFSCVIIELNSFVFKSEDFLFI